MTRTGYAFDMSTTPNPDYINEKALERLMHAFDKVLTGKTGTISCEKVPDWEYGDPLLRAADHALRRTSHDVEREGGEPHNIAPKVTMGCVPAGTWPQPQIHRPSFWHTFPPLRVIRYIRDTIRLRKYNVEWLKNNPQMTIAEAIMKAHGDSHLHSNHPK